MEYNLEPHTSYYTRSRMLPPDRPPHRNPIATFVRTQRRLANITQVEFADIAGVSLSFLRAVEQGKPNLQLEKVNLLLAFFGHELAPVERSQSPTA